MASTYKANITITGSTFAERETCLNREIEKVQRSLVSRGFRVTDFEINSKTTNRATVTFIYS